LGVTRERNFTDAKKVEDVTFEDVLRGKKLRGKKLRGKKEESCKSKVTS